MHKDQVRVKDVLLPQLVLRTITDSPEAVRDCTVVNRVFIQGPDPLLLMETCPESFTLLCSLLQVPEAAGREAIEKAHWQGPGVLLEGKGLQEGATLNQCSQAICLEALWLIMASVSDCTEEGYVQEVPMVERIRRVMKAAVKFSYLVNQMVRQNNPLEVAIQSMRTFSNDIKFVFDARGFPHTSKDGGFYVGYKLGYPVVAVTAGPHTFWGTQPNTTLAAHRVLVDKELSPTFGIVFGDK